MMYDDELTPKGDGTYTARKHKRADGSEYVLSGYKNVDRGCTCEGPERRYCTNLLSKIGHTDHICVLCGGIMKECRTR